MIDNQSVLIWLEIIFKKSSKITKYFPHISYMYIHIFKNRYSWDWDVVRHPFLFLFI